MQSLTAYRQCIAMLLRQRENKVLLVYCQVFVLHLKTLIPNLFLWTLFMLSKKILGLTSTVLLLSISQAVLADHGPQRMFKRQIQPYFSAHETKQMGPFKIDIHSYGQEVTHSLPNVDAQKYKHIFHDRFNLAALLRESDEIVFKRFHKG